MDTILNSYLNDFSVKHDLDRIPANDVLQHFVNFCIVIREHPENFNFEEVIVDGPNDMGIDGIAILVNDHLVTSREEITHFKNQLKRFDVKFVFVQTKSSDCIKAGDVGSFLQGVRNFFLMKTNENDAIANRKIQRLIALKDFIFDSSIDMDEAPSCCMYFACAGHWTNDLNVENRVTTCKKDLASTGLFSSVIFSPMDLEKLKTLYKELNLKITKEIEFEKHTIIPASENISEAYVGIISSQEYIKLISDSEGKILKSVFYDNVRDFQGNNSVNQEIDETLNDPLRKEKFALFNNGITIVARSINKVGAKFKIIDYQIVNGCQTSHLLHKNKDVLTSNIYIPIKLIVTDNNDVINMIIMATNRQTEVKIEAFESLQPFQKALEEYYLAYRRDKGSNLYYERRSKQYVHENINEKQIISLTAQVKSFLSMFQNEPHSTHRYYGELIKAYRDKIFLESHSCYPYFVSGYALNRITRILDHDRAERPISRCKYQLLMLFRMISEDEQMPYLNSRGIEKYCDKIVALLSDDARARVVVDKAIEILRSALSKTKYQEPWRSKNFTQELIQITQLNRKVIDRPADICLEEGTVVSFSDIKGYGFIKTEKHQSHLFVHYTGIKGTGYKSLDDGERVKFTILETPRGLQAIDVVKFV